MRRPLPNRISNIVLTLGLAAGLLSGCGSGADSGAEGESTGEASLPASKEVVEHPVEARIPYYGQATPVMKEPPLSALPDPPEELKTLAAFLDDPSTIDTTRLNVLVEESRTIEIASVSPDRLVLLAGHPDNRLFEHDLRTGTTKQIARTGEGPGEIKFAQAVARRDSSVYVAHQARRIDRFNCAASPCTYRETSRLRFGPMALAATNVQLAVVGEPMLRSEGMKIDDLSGAVQIVGSNGDIRQTIGRMYQANHFLVLSNYVRSSSLIYSDAQGQFVFASPKLSLVWAYDTDGGLESVWTIDDFEPLPLEYDSSARSIHKEYEEGYSTLRLQGPIAGRFVVATVRHKALPSAASDLAGRGNDYYALDLTSGDTYFLGRDTPREGIVDRLVLVTDEHQVLIENGRVAVITEPTYSKASGIQARSKRVPEPQEF